MKFTIEIDSENWYTHENDHSFSFVAFRPTSTNLPALARP
jgi:hypothetical protein